MTCRYITLPTATTLPIHKDIICNVHQWARFGKLDIEIKKHTNHEPNTPNTNLQPC